MTGTADAKPAAAEKAVARKEQRKAREEAWLIVTGPERGRRRAGHAFGASATELRIADLTDEDVAAIKGDPQLVAAIEMRPGEAATEDA